MSNTFKFPCNNEFGIDRRVEIFEVKFVVPLLIGLGSFLISLSYWFKDYVVKCEIKFKTALLIPSKHSSLAFELKDSLQLLITLTIKKLIFYAFISLYIYIYNICYKKYIQKKSYILLKF